MASRDPDPVARDQRNDALKDLRRTYESTMLRVASAPFGGVKVVKNGHDAQEAVDRAFEEFDRGNLIATTPPAARRGLLHQIALRRAIDMVKHAKPVADLADHDHDPRIAQDEPGYEDVDDADEVRRAMDWVRSEMDRLKPKERETLQRLYLRGQSSAEAAADMHLTDRRVRQLRNTALAALRQTQQSQSSGDSTDDRSTTREEGT